jgi:hypothetical protein
MGRRAAAEGDPKKENVKQETGEQENEADQNW